AGSGTAIPGLTNNGTYYVIRVDADKIRLAGSAEGAVAGRALLLAAPDAATQHSLTPVVTFARVGALKGGQEHDTVALALDDAPRGPRAQDLPTEYRHQIIDINPNQTDLSPAHEKHSASGGRINHLGSAGNGSTFYAASEFGGLFKTDDGGDRWVSLEGHL